jgi:hypothetical protein
MDAVVRWREVNEDNFSVNREGATIIRGCGSLVDAEKGLRARFDTGEGCYLAVRGVFRISEVIDLTEPTEDEIMREDSPAADARWDHMSVEEKGWHETALVEEGEQ